MTVKLPALSGVTKVSDLKQTCCEIAIPFVQMRFFHKKIAKPMPMHPMVCHIIRRDNKNQPRFGCKFFTPNQGLGVIPGWLKYIYLYWSIWLWWKKAFSFLCSEKIQNLIFFWNIFDFVFYLSRVAPQLLRKNNKSGRKPWQCRESFIMLWIGG